MKTRRPRSLSVEGVNHGKAPIPMGALVGNVLYSSGINGIDPKTGELGGNVVSQAHHAFGNLRALLAAGGATLEDVVRLTVHLKDDSGREPVNAEWLTCFPDPHDRPARHTLIYEHLQHGILLQLEAVAVIERDE